MNSRNLSRFHKFSGSNFKKKITEIEIQLHSFLHSSQIQIQKRIQEERKKKKPKFYYRLYTEFLSVPLFLGSEDESYFTILILSIYDCQKKLCRIPQKISKWNYQKKSPIHCLRSRPWVDVATWILFICSSSVATKLLQLRPMFLATSLISGHDLNCGCDLYGSVVLKNLCRDLNLTLRPRCSSLLLQL